MLTVSPDGKKVIVSDTQSTPNEVFVFDTAGKTSITLPIAGATAADYSPDSLKAYILAGSTLYVYSTLEALKTIALGASATEVSFLPEGGFAVCGGRRGFFDHRMEDLHGCPGSWTNRDYSYYSHIHQSTFQEFDRGRH